MGIADLYLSILSGLMHETVIVDGSRINDAMIYRFGNYIQSLYQTNHVSGHDDNVTSKLSYWTDDDAYYYGDDWKEAVFEPH